MLYPEPVDQNLRDFMQTMREAFKSNWFCATNP